MHSADKYAILFTKQFEICAFWRTVPKYLVFGAPLDTARRHIGEATSSAATNRNLNQCSFPAQVVP